MKSIRELNLDEAMEMELVQERMHKFWEPSKDEKKEVVNFLAVELMDETDLQELFFELCSQDIDDHDKIFAAAKKLLSRAQSAIYEYAQNDRLPITILTNEPEDARAMARGQI
jgi:hypothetical protein